MLIFLVRILTLADKMTNFSPHTFYKNYLASELSELYAIGGIGPNPKNIPLTEETKNIVLRALAGLFLLPYPNTTQSDQKWNERAKLFTCLVESQPAKFDFISSCCFLVYSESVACRKSCAAGIRNIIYEAVPRINTFNVDIKETKAAMNLTSDYFNCMKQEATKDMELCRRTVQACFEVIIATPSRVDKILVGGQTGARASKPIRGL